jgi:hypothetical protein
MARTEKRAVNGRHLATTGKRKTRKIPSEWREIWAG